MTNPTPKRFRPRFSIRTLLIVVTLVCCYAASWGPTKRYDEWDVFNLRPLDGVQPGPRLKAVMPLILGTYGFDPRFDSLVFSDGATHSDRERFVRRYYFWFFGYVAKLPWEREVKYDGQW
jgi:hypothetical protein